MTDETREFWNRALKTFTTAIAILENDPDNSASRSYYAAFYAVSAYFSLIGQFFTKHSAVEAAVHRDLVKTGIWEADLGSLYSSLMELRATGDYGVIDHVIDEDAKEGIHSAKMILLAVQKSNPSFFQDPDGILKPS